MNNSIYKHIYTEFRFGDVFSTDQWTLLYEKDGLMKGIDHIERIISDFLSKQDIGAKQKEIIIPTIYFSKIKDLPFDSLNIKLNVSINPAQDNWRKGSYSLLSQPKHPMITIYANGSTFKNMVYEVCKSLCHECIHAIERDGVKHNTGKEMMDIQRNNGYPNFITHLSDGGDIERLFRFLYWTNPCERKAFIGNLYGELQAHADEIMDSKTAYNALMKTDAWKGFKKWENTVDELNRGKNSAEYTKHILSVYNQAMGTNITNYPTFLKMINRRWRKMKKNVEEKVSRLLFRIYKNYGRYALEIYPGVY